MQFLILYISRELKNVSRSQRDKYLLKCKTHIVINDHIFQAYFGLSKQKCGVITRAEFNAHYTYIPYFL